MPAYEPDPWNKAGVNTSNNCYNYATDVRQAPPEGEPPRNPAVPGRSKGITPGVVEQVLILRGPPEQVRIAWRFTCESVKAGCLLDGLGEPVDGSCGDGCWKIAYYTRPTIANPDPSLRQVGDYHFVRQDSDGKWSHKPNAGTIPVTRNQYDPVQRTYTGDPISDPERDSVGPGYRFCGYLCVCPGRVTIAAMDRPNADPGQALAQLFSPESSSFPTSTLLDIDRPTLLAQLDSQASRAEGVWRPGPASETVEFRIQLPASGVFSAQIVDLGPTTLTVWDRGARHIQGPPGHFTGWLQRGAGKSVPGDCPAAPSQSPCS